MPFGALNVRVITGKQNSATAIARGQAVVQNDTADGQNVIRSGANAAKPLGIAFEDSPGQNTSTSATQFQVAVGGIVKVKAGGTVTQGNFGESDANGNLVNATSGAGRNVFGTFMESGVSGDLVDFRLDPGTITV